MTLGQNFFEHPRDTETRRISEPLPAWPSFCNPCFRQFSYIYILEHCSVNDYGARLRI